MTTQLTLPAAAGKPRQPIGEALDRDLHYWSKRLGESLDKDPGSKFAAQNRELLDAIVDELGARKSGAKSAPASVAIAPAPARNEQIAKAQPTALDVRDPATITRQLAEMARNYHLITPSARVDVLPEGCGVAVSYVAVDPNPDPYHGPKEVYDVGGRLGLSGSTLTKIAAAAGLSWDVGQCGRLDNGSDPHYCHYRAVGVVRMFDGSSRVVSGEVEMDARDGSPQIEEIKSKAAHGRKGPRDPSQQILELRKFLLRHAESKAKNRAIADMGVRRSYAPAELSKPFAVARLTWTGESSDPELRRVFAEKTADAMLGGMSAIYRPRLPEHARPAPVFAGHVPPPVGSVEDSGPWGAYDVDTVGREPGEEG